MLKKVWFSLHFSQETNMLPNRPLIDWKRKEHRASNNGSGADGTEDDEW